MIIYFLFLLKKKKKNMSHDAEKEQILKSGDKQEWLYLNSNKHITKRKKMTKKYVAGFSCY